MPNYDWTKKNFFFLWICVKCIPKHIIKNPFKKKAKNIFIILSLNRFLQYSLRDSEELHLTTPNLYLHTKSRLLKKRGFEILTRNSFLSHWTQFFSLVINFIFPPSAYRLPLSSLFRNNVFFVFIFLRRHLKIGYSSSIYSRSMIMVTRKSAVQNLFLFLDFSHPFKCQRTYIWI